MLTREQAYLKFKQLLQDRAAEIDPDNELDWHSLGVGLFIGLGESPEIALELSAYIRYETDLG